MYGLWEEVQESNECMGYGKKYRSQMIVWAMGGSTGVK